MLINLTTPRPVLDHTRYPEHIYLHTLSKSEVSDGAVLFTGVHDPEHGQRGTKNLDPRELVTLDGGVAVRVYILPFWELFAGGQQTAMSDGEIVRAANLKVVRYCTAGFQVTAKSAFRASPREYLEHMTAFSMAFPATGGGVLRLADVHVDIANPSFDPWAPNPYPSSAEAAELRETYARAHAMLSDGANDRRRARIAAAEASMRAESTRDETPTLPEGNAVRALPPKGEEL